MNLSLEELKNVTIIFYSNTRTVQIAEFPEKSHFLNQHHSSLARHVNGTSQKSLDCSQSPIFPCDRRCRCGSHNASETGESTKCPWVFFPPSHPTILTPPPLPKGSLFSPQFRSHQEISRDQGDGPLELNDRHRGSHGKIGGCEQSRKSLDFQAWSITKPRTYSEWKFAWISVFSCSDTSWKVNSQEDQ